MTTVVGCALYSTPLPVPPASKGGVAWALPPLYESVMLWGPPQSPDNLEPPLVDPQGSGSRSLFRHLLEELGPGLRRLAPLSAPLGLNQGVSSVPHLHIITFIIRHVHEKSKTL